MRKKSDKSLVFRSYSTLYFVKAGWAKQRKLVEPLVDAIAGTAMWEHVPLLSVGIAPAKPRGSLAAVKKALMSGKSRYAFIDRGKTPFSDEATASFTIEVGAGGVQLMTSIRGPILDSLGAAAIDDLFGLLCALHDGLDGAAHVAGATAWTDCDENSPSSDVSSLWPLRAIADVIEPVRPEEEDDEAWAAGRVLAKAKLPRGVTRKTHGGLVMLRWTKDPCDWRAADAAAVAHEAWVVAHVETQPSS